MGHDPVWAFTKLVQKWETPPIHPDEWVETHGPGGEQGWLKLSSPIVGNVEDGIAAIAGPLALAFAACLAYGLRQLPSWRVRLMWLGTVLLGSVATGLPMAFADPLIIAQVDAGNPLFQPIIGYSSPVFVVNILACVGIWMWFGSRMIRKT
jgi:hypothetical protein